ncbi:MAG TPA: hypothetical protein VE377_13110 [Candidatus Dormibacteraeota bacterium]|nr:hypothetical protein [Candidatus Dormibacteraeota bacterium]
MSRDHNNNDVDMRVDLKYCEHCGKLYLRESGSEMVYCEKCHVKVADLPIPKKKPGRVRLPVHLQSLPDFPGEKYGIEISTEELIEMKAVGGVA